MKRKDLKYLIAFINKTGGLLFGMKEFKRKRKGEEVVYTPKRQDIEKLDNKYFMKFYDHVCDDIKGYQSDVEKKQEKVSMSPTLAQHIKKKPDKTRYKIHVNSEIARAAFAEGLKAYREQLKEDDPGMRLDVAKLLQFNHSPEGEE